MKTYSEDQLKAKAKEYFDHNPKADKLLATSDGQFFLPENDNAAKAHAQAAGKKGNPRRIYTIDRPKPSQKNDKPTDSTISKPAAKLIKENGLKAEDITGTGANGNVTKGDVEAYMKQKMEEGLEALKAAEVDDDKEEESAEAATTEPEGSEEGKQEAPNVSTTAAKLIEENDLDVKEITGTGQDGKITKTDVEAYLKQLKAAEEAAGKGN